MGSEDNTRQYSIVIVSILWTLIGPHAIRYTEGCTPSMPSYSDTAHDFGKLGRVRDFWNESPCDGQPEYAMRARFRYRKDPWLIPILERIAANYGNILEVGCGQGTDAITLCGLLPAGSQYAGVDMSEVSLSRARASANELAAALRVTPLFQLENAEHLTFDDNHFDCVLSVGALHHSANTERAISEVRRVLKPGGAAFVFLYKKSSPKVFGAHILRGVQSGLDSIFGKDRVVYRALRGMNLGDAHGTALYECFGVPILRSYTRRHMRTLFQHFASVRLNSYGPGILPTSGRRTSSGSSFGYLWLAEAQK
jgi:ubiquinone/menaquinone biosynthesis C-methylase UbiE